MTTIAILIAALGIHESGNNDFAKGKSGEVSRYQIMPAVWREETRSRMWHDPEVSRNVAERILNARIRRFVTITHRLPTSKEVYCLWNKPGRFEARNFDIDRLDPKTVKRCERFAKTVDQVLADNGLMSALDKPKARSQK